MAYNSKILEYANKRERFGGLEETKEVGVGYVGNAACGDMLKVYIKVNEFDLIEDVKVKSYGCGCAIASTALAAEKLIGRTIDQALQLTDKELADELDLPGIKKHCSVLAQAAVKKAVENYQSKQGEYEFEISKSALNNETEKPVSNGCCNKGGSELKKPAKNITHFILTDSAKARLRQIVKLYPEAIGIKISSQAGGCAGNSYNLEIAYDVENDVQSYVFDDFTIFVPKASLMYVLGSTIDYQETETKAGFVFQNPSLKMCGCGSSFG